MAEKFHTSWADVRSYTDWAMVLVTLVLFCCGLAAIYSASASFASGDAVSGFVVRQCVWGALGACAYLAVVKLDYRNAMRFAWPMFGAMLAMLMLKIVWDVVHG